jgi:hypothetical protein
VVISEGWPAWLPILSSVGARVSALVGKQEFLEGMEDIAVLELGLVRVFNFLSALPRNTMVTSELCMAWDLPVKWVKGLGTVDQREEIVHNICWAPPCKSLWAFGQHMKCFGLELEPDDTSDLGSKLHMKYRGFGVFVDDALKQEGAALAGLETDAERHLREAKAVKVDDAAVPVHLWNSRVFALFPHLFGDVDPNAGETVCNILCEQLLL